MIDYDVFCIEYAHLSNHDRANKWGDLCIEDAAIQIKEEVDKNIMSELLEAAKDPDGRFK